MWRRTNETNPPVSSPEPPAAPAAIPVARPALAPPVAVEPRQVKTVLGRGLAVKGELSGREDVTIDGVFEGQIHVAGAGVTIGANGRVSAEVDADEIVVEGRFEGSLRARERVTLRRACNVSGTIETRRLLIEDGAILSGRVEMAFPGEALGTARSNEAPAARAERGTLRAMTVSATGSAS
jgi:cytoskeletal protein CcmA (bactofilin family)